MKRCPNCDEPVGELATECFQCKHVFSVEKSQAQRKMGNILINTGVIMFFVIFISGLLNGFSSGNPVIFRLSSVLTFGLIAGGIWLIRLIIIRFKTSNGTSNGWISGMRIIAWISFAAIIIAGLFLAENFDSAMIGFGIFVGSVLTAFISVAGIMIFLDMADNIRRVNDNTLQIVKSLEKIQNTNPEQK